MLLDFFIIIIIAQTITIKLHYKNTTETIKQKYKYTNYETIIIIVKFINYSLGCKPIPAQYSDHMYTTVNPNTTPAQLTSSH